MITLSQSGVLVNQGEFRGVNYSLVAALIMLLLHCDLLMNNPRKQINL